MGRQGFYGEENQGCRPELAAGTSPVKTVPALAVDPNSQLKVKPSENVKLWLGLASQLSSNYKEQTGKTHQQAEEDQMHYQKKLEQCSKSLDDFQSFLNRENTRPVHSQTNRNDERTQESAPPKGRQKRLVKQTRKALEAAETENLFFKPVKLKKRKGHPLSLLDKPGALNVSLTSELSVEGRGRNSAEMATERRKEHKVKGKENVAPVKSHILRFKRQKYEFPEAENKGWFTSLVGSESEEDQMHYEKLEQYSNSLDDFQIFHNQANTRPVHSQTNCNDERTQELASPMGRQKRLIKQTRKALEAAETENLFSKPVNLEKRKGHPLSLLDMPGALSVSLTSELGVEGRGRKNAEMATELKKEHKVKGKENEAPVKSHILRFKRQKHEFSEAENKGCFRYLVGSESASYMPKIKIKFSADRPAKDQAPVTMNFVMDHSHPTEAIEQMHASSPLQGVEQNSQLKVKQSSDAKLWLALDSKLPSTNKMCNQLMETPKQPASQTQQAEGNQSRLTYSQTKSTKGDKMLGNHLPKVGLTKNYCIMEEEDSRATNQGDLEQSVLNNSVRLVHGRSSYHRQLNQHERIMLKYEDDRYEVDMVLEIIQSTISQTERWIDDINSGSRKQLQDYFNGFNTRCVERLYGSRGLDFLEMLQNYSHVVLPILLERLKQKAMEIEIFRAEFNDSMVKAFFENFKNSLEFSSKQIQ